jgi:ornithine cyclodeaminase/alanine dehydrogenase-like protein (mu-crystallin family)
MLLLTDETIKSLLSVKDCVGEMELAYRELGEKQAVEVGRERMFLDDRKTGIVYRLGRQCGAVTALGVAALRVNSTRRGFRKGIDRKKAFQDPKDHHLVLLFSLENGELLAILHGFTLSGLRLGATTAVATKYLAREGANQVGVYGSGKQARANLEGIAAVTQLKTAKVYSPDRSHRELFSREMGERLNISVVPVDDPKEVLRGASIVLCATSAWEPIFDGRFVEDGALVISLRNSDHEKTPREFDETIISRSPFIVVCSKAQITHDNQRELLDHIEAGVMSWENIYELSDLVCGAIKRRSAEEILFYHSNTGMGIQFAAVGHKVLNAAREKGLGTNLPDDWFHADLTPWFELGFRPTS